CTQSSTARTKFCFVHKVLLQEPSFVLYTKFYGRNQVLSTQGPLCELSKTSPNFHAPQAQINLWLKVLKYCLNLSMGKSFINFPNAKHRFISFLDITILASF
ncbi:hypothetical protein V8G54_033736, partial [Vigna mungo]